MEWLDAIALVELDANPQKVVRLDGRQILISRTERGIFACPNRCPHEGFPLSEGELCTNGMLRCNWHNWTFDLVSGKTLVGNDLLTQFPVKIEAGRVFIGRSEPDPLALEQSALMGLRAALDDNDQARLLRETARLMLAGADPLVAIREAIAWCAPHLPYGTTHAIGGAADWIGLAQAPGTPPDRALAALGEVLGHLADDARRERHVPIASEVRSWDASGFIGAVETGDEPLAVAIVRGALACGMHVADLVPTLATAALTHYAGFGHALIYTVKSAELAARLGESVEESLLVLLVRSFTFAAREDLLPEFRGYAKALADWSRDVSACEAGRPPLLVDVSVANALATVAAWSAKFRPEQIFRTLVDSAAFALLHVDEATLATTDGSIAKNASWLDLTHAITFAEAGERVARDSPELWPAVLLQIACFIGRNHAIIDFAQSTSAWQKGSPRETFAELRYSLFDHGRERFIISVHLIKTLASAERLVDDGHADGSIMAAAIARFFHAPMKGRHVLRTARQMLAVASQR